MDLYGIIGRPLGHSLSVDYFTKKFAAEETLDSKEYRRFELDTIDALPETVASHRDLRGLNVTYPYKEQILPYLDSLSDEARRIGAVNCVRVEEDGRLVGYNTDYAGFSSALADFLDGADALPKALVLGTGGASKAVRCVLRDEGYDFLTVSRSASAGDITYADLDGQIIAERHLIINATPLGMWPETAECPDIPYGLLTEEHFLFDLIYNPPTTEFLRRGQLRGTAVCNGQRMFVCQAEASWRIFGRP